MKDIGFPVLVSGGVMILVMIFLGFSGCVHQNTYENNTEPSPVLSIPATPSLVGFASPAIPGTTSSPNLVVNYTAIRFIGQADISHPMDEARKNAIAEVALADDRVRSLLIDGGMIEGVLYQCHPTPKNFSGPACAPALRVSHNGTNWDFLVDEESRNVIFVQHDTPMGALT
ncbi:MAG: hypothetical protein M0Q92_03555 [Methanoregula sp.]|jgi:hypothetical protein|nr:hypothetical protein [Methanoregula sp.]